VDDRQMQAGDAVGGEVDGVAGSSRYSPRFAAMSWLSSITSMRMGGGSSKVLL
jgi:hypothetical protein